MAVSVKMIESVIRQYFAPCHQAGARSHCLLCRCLSVVDAIESADDKDSVRLYIKDSEPILSADIDAKLRDNGCRMFPIIGKYGDSEGVGTQSSGWSVLINIPPQEQRRSYSSDRRRPATILPISLAELAGHEALISRSRLDHSSARSFFFFLRAPPRSRRDSGASAGS